MSPTFLHHHSKGVELLRKNLSSNSHILTYLTRTDARMKSGGRQATLLCSHYRKNRQQCFNNRRKENLCYLFCNPPEAEWYEAFQCMRLLSPSFSWKKNSWIRKSWTEHVMDTFPWNALVNASAFSQWIDFLLWSAYPWLFMQTLFGIGMWADFMVTY